MKIREQRERGKGRGDRKQPSRGAGEQRRGGEGAGRNTGRKPRRPWEKFERSRV
jgi:hypothetical protein